MDGPMSFLTPFRSTKSSAGEDGNDTRRELAKSNETPNQTLETNRPAPPLGVRR